MRTSRTDRSIGTLYLSPDFLDQHQPNFLSYWLAKDWPIGLSEYRDVVVYYHFCWSTLFDYYKLVDSLLANFKVFIKYIRYSFLNLSEGSDRRKKIAVIEVALADIFKFKLRFVHNAIFNNLTNSLPCYRPSSDIEMKIRFVRWKLLIYKPNFFNLAFLTIVFVF